MSYFSMLGIVLLIWLLVGFFVALKIIWVEDRFNSVAVAEHRKTLEATENDSVIHLYDIFSMKKNAFVLLTMLGFISAILEVKRTINKIKKFFFIRKINKGKRS